MLAAAVVDERLIEVCIAINAAISAGVVCAEIYAGNTSARGTLVFISLDIKLTISDALQTVPVYTAGMPYSVPAEINILSAGVDTDAVLLCNLTEISGQFLSLLRSQWTNSERSDTSFDALI